MGHMGRKKTKEKCKLRYYWYLVNQDLDNYIASCSECQQTKPPAKNIKAPLGSMPVGHPWERISIDLVGPLPRTERNNRYCMVVCDDFSKWVELLPIPDATAETCARVLINEIFARYGCSYLLHSDQGKSFENELFKELCRLLQIKKTRSSPRHPQSNAICERFNKTLWRMIRAYIKDQRDWDLFLGCLAGAYRATPHISTGFSPNRLIFGSEVKLPSDILLGIAEINDNFKNFGDFLKTLKNRLNSAHNIAREHLGKQAKARKKYYDVNTCLNSYRPGQYALLINETRQIDSNPKLQSAYLKVKIVEKISSLNYKIAVNKKYRIVHHDKLRPLIGF